MCVLCVVCFVRRSNMFDLSQWRSAKCREVLMSLFVCVVEIECSWLMCSSCFCCQHNLSTRSQPNTHFRIDHESHIEFVKLQVVSFPFPSRCSLWSLSLLSQTLPPKRKAIFKHNLELIKQRNANQVLVRNSPL